MFPVLRMYTNSQSELPDGIHAASCPLGEAMNPAPVLKNVQPDPKLVDETRSKSSPSVTPLVNVWLICDTCAASPVSACACAAAVAARSVCVNPLPIGTFRNPPTKLLRIVLMPGMN